MNRILLQILLTSWFHVSVAQHKFTISGKLTRKFENATITLISTNTGLSTTYTKVDNGQYVIKGEMYNRYQTAYMHISQEEETTSIGPFFISPGNMKIDLMENAERQNIHFAGIPFIKEQFTYDSLVKPIKDSMSRLYNLISVADQGYLPHLSKDSLSTAYSQLREKYKRRVLGFINGNLNSFFSLYQFNENLKGFHFKEKDTETLLSVFDAFPDSLRKTELGKSVHLQLEKRKSLLIGKTLPDFHFTSLSNHSYSLSKWRNKKYILLCFWASWCGPCIRSIPLFSKIAEEYRGKDLQIIYISTDKEKDKWLKAVKQSNPPGLQVCDLIPYVSENQKLNDLYNIRYIPQYFLIDKEGKLIYHSGQMNDDKTDEYHVLQEVLSQIFYHQAL